MYFPYKTLIDKRLIFYNIVSQTINKFMSVIVAFFGHTHLSILNRGSYMSAHVLFNLSNELGKRDKMRGLLDSIYHTTNTLKSHFWRKNVMILSSCTQRCYGRNTVSRKSVNH